jgi:hypothetical protein
MKRLVSSTLVVFFLIMTAGVSLAQVQTGEIFGRVADSTGAVLPGVTVTVQGPSLLQPRVTITTATGAFRQPGIPIGLYTVTFEMSGFATVTRTGIRIETGFSAEINAVMGISGVKEVVTVSGAAPVVDTKTTASGAVFSRETLENIPTARDPWVMIQQTPGIVMARENVGGSASGQQYSWVARGGTSGNAMWNLDGATITDMADSTSPMYYDFDSFEEIQIQTGGNDASLETGGVNINFITKSGSNAFRGSGRFMLVDKSVQSSNVTPALKAMGAGAGNPVKNIKDYGFEIGGPIAKNRLWFWGGVGYQDIDVGVVGFYKPGATDPYNPDSLESDITNLRNANLKLQAQLDARQKVTLQWTYSDKIRPTRGAGPTYPIETTMRQTGPTGVYKASHQFVASDRLMVETMASYVSGGYKTDFHAPELADVQRAVDISTGMNSRSTQASFFDRPAWEFKTDASYFLSGFLGGDHATKFGVRYKTNPYRTVRHVGGGATARFSNGAPIEAEITRDQNTRRALWAWAAYFNDSYSLKRLHVNVGVRADYQKDKAEAATVPGSPILPDLLPTIDFKGADSGAHFFDLSPRFGVTYDLRGNGKTVLKANYAQYFGQGIYTADTLSPTTAITLRYPWNDLNGDRFIQRNELDLTRLLSYSSNYDPAHPDAPLTPNKVDANLKSDRTVEAVVGIEHELMKDFAVSVSYVWRRYDRFTWTPRIGLSSTNYTPVTYSAVCGNATCGAASYSVVYYQLPFQIPAASLLTNQDYYRDFNGIEATARKRFSDRWLMNASFALNSSVNHYPGPQSYEDPTTIGFANNAQAASLNARWVGKLSGMYSLPFGINASATLNTRQGYPLIKTIQSPTRTGSLGRVNVPLVPYGEERFPNLTLIDVRLEKWFRFKRTQVALSVDVFNLGNANTVQDQETRQNVSAANNVFSILPPRVARFGVRFKF